jgi:hypothetical protein
MAPLQYEAMKVTHAATRTVARSQAELHARAIARVERLRRVFDTGAARADAAGFQAGDGTRLIHEDRPAKNKR